MSPSGQHMLCHFASIVTSSFADIKAVLLFAMLCLHYQGRMLALFLIICCILFSVVALDPSGLQWPVTKAGPQTNNRHRWKNYEPQHLADVEESTSQSAAELFINCGVVEVFTAAHVSVTHSCGVATRPPFFAPVRAPPHTHTHSPTRAFHEVKETSGAL